MSKSRKQRHAKNSGQNSLQKTPANGSTVKTNAIPNSVPGLPADNTHKMEIVASKSSFHSGPLPAPEDLAAYEKVTPGLADRIVSMAENQSSHRHKLETQVITSDIRRSWGGLAAAFVIGMTGLIGGIYVICQDHDWAGTTVICSALGSLVGTFLYGRRKKSERLEKTKESVSK